jgi:hypothetical protein
MRSLEVKGLIVSRQDDFENAPMLTLIHLGHSTHAVREELMSFGEQTQDSGRVSRSSGNVILWVVRVDDGETIRVLISKADNTRL